MFTNTKIPIIIISILLGLFLAAAWFGYRHLATKSMDPLQAFPKNTSFILEIPKPSDFFQKLNNENIIWNDLKSDTNTAAFNQFFTELIQQSKNDERLASFLNQSFYFTMVPAEAKKSDFLLIAKQENLNLEALDTKFFSKLNNIRYTAPNKDSAFASLQTHFATWFLIQNKGLFFISSRLKTLQDIQIQLKDAKAFAESADFKQLELTRGKRADIYFYAAYNSSDTLLSTFLSPEGMKLKISSFANYSVLDILLKKDALLFNGYTSAYDSLNQVLASFQNQRGQKSNLAASLPYSTQSYIEFNLSDYPSFIHKQIELNQLQNSLEKIDKMIHGNSLEITADWWDGEMALVVDDKQNEYAVIKAKSGREAFRQLADIANQSQPGIILETYREQEIKEINSPDFLISQFGTLFSGFKEVYFCVIDESVIFSKSMTELKSYIDAIILGNNLSKNEAYIEFSDNLTEDAVIQIYSKTPQFTHPFFQLFASEGKSLIANYGNIIQHTKGIGIQISAKNNLFYTGLIIKFGTSSIEKPSAWQVELEAPIEAGPFLVKNHDTDGNNILVQDEFNTLYFLNAKGDIVWSQPLKEKIISQVFPIDYFKNGKWQYLFNTPNFIYLIDINGNPVADYPVQLNSEASNGLQVIDYDSNKEYRIFIACKNGEVYNYESNGRLLKGWKAENTRKEIVKPISHLIANKKDYLIFEASNGNIIMTDRKGDKRMEVRTAFTNALGSDIYLNRTNSSKGMFLSTDKNGDIVYIPETGSVNKTTFELMSPNHFFLYADFDMNSDMDFIYLDGKKLRVYDKFKNVLLTFDFNNPILIKPALYTINNKSYLGVVDQSEKRLYLFDKNGLLTDKIRKGNTPFIIGKLAKNTSPSILIGLDKSVYNYPLD